MHLMRPGGLCFSFWSMLRIDQAAYPRAYTRCSCAGVRLSCEHQDYELWPLHGFIDLSIDQAG